jgi:hypothetical protein
VKEVTNEDGADRSHAAPIFAAASENAQLAVHAEKSDYVRRAIIIIGLLAGAVLLGFVLWDGSTDDGSDAPVSRVHGRS